MQKNRTLPLALTVAVCGMAGAQAPVEPVNSKPNPYQTVEGWAKMPDGRTWGSTSAVEIDPDGTSIWVAERCGANSCASSDLPVVLKFATGGGVARAEILGPRRDRTVTFVRHIDEVVPFTERTAEDPTLPRGARVLKQRGIDGYAIRRYRVIRQGAVAVRETATDRYPPTQQIWRVGTGAMPIINYPEVAILGVARARQEPAVHNGAIVPRLHLPLSLTFDHRVADGADGARFASSIVRSLEHPDELLLEL